MAPRTVVFESDALPSRPSAGPSAGPSGRSLDEADAALGERLNALAQTQRDIDALLARRARQLTQALAAAFDVESVLAADGGGTSSARREEFVRRSLRAEVALALRTSERAAERLLGDAEMLEKLPCALASVESGALSWRAAETIAEQASTLSGQVSPDECAEALARFEAEAVRIAGIVAPSRLRSRLTALRERIATATATERHRAARDERRVFVEDDDNGMSWLHAYLPSVEAHAVNHRLTDIARALPEHLERPEADARTLGQRRADLLVDLLAGDRVRVNGGVGSGVDGGGGSGAVGGAVGGAAGGATFEPRTAEGLEFARFAGIRPTVVVTVPVQTLLGADGTLGPASEPPMLDGVVPLDPATARELTANAPGLYRLLTDAHSGVPLDLGRRRYDVSTPLRLWLRLRDGTCRFPGCGRPARGCDVDHSVDWQFGGTTSPDNLAHLCRGHHTLKHQTRWDPRQHPDGSISWRSPSGAEHLTRPEQPVARTG